MWESWRTCISSLVITCVAIVQGICWTAHVVLRDIHQDVIAIPRKININRLQSSGACGTCGTCAVCKQDMTILKDMNFQPCYFIRRDCRRRLLNFIEPKKKLLLCWHGDIYCLPYDFVLYSVVSVHYILWSPPTYAREPPLIVSSRSQSSRSRKQLQLFIRFILFDAFEYSVHRVKWIIYHRGGTNMRELKRSLPCLANAFADGFTWPISVPKPINEDVLSSCFFIHTFAIDDEFSLQELRSALTSFRRHSSPGTDGITYHALKILMPPCSDDSLRCVTRYGVLQSYEHQGVARLWFASTSLLFCLGKQMEKWLQRRWVRNVQ